MTNQQNMTLQKARETYGSKNQILVAIEELNELACVLAKYGRYEQHDTAVEKLREKVIDELADVQVVTAHVMAIFGIVPSEIDDRASLKIERLERWMSSSESFEQTTVDREVKDKI